MVRRRGGLQRHGDGAPRPEPRGPLQLLLAAIRLKDSAIIGWSISKYIDLETDLDLLFLYGQGNFSLLENKMSMGRGLKANNRAVASRKLKACRNNKMTD